jgi:hypothetical protein
MLAFGVHVKEGIALPLSTMASRFTFNPDTMQFEEIKKFDNEFFDIGLMSFLPRECQLTEDEILGAGNPYAKEEESDFEDDEEDDGDNEVMAFEKETKQTLERCIKNKFPISNAIMEMKSLKMTYNMGYSECVEAFFPIIFGHISSLEGSADDTAKRAKNIQSFLTEWKAFIKDFVREDPDQFTLIRCAEIFAAENAPFSSTFHIIIQVLFTLKVLSSQIIQ